VITTDTQQRSAMASVTKKALRDVSSATTRALSLLSIYNPVILRGCHCSSTFRFSVMNGSKSRSKHLRWQTRLLKKRKSIWMRLKNRSNLNHRPFCSSWKKTLASGSKNLRKLAIIASETCLVRMTQRHSLSSRSP
jgi:hypothetical protein